MGGSGCGCCDNDTHTAQRECVYVCANVCVPVNCPIWRARADAASAALMCEQQKSKRTKYVRTYARLMPCSKGVWLEGGAGASTGCITDSADTKLH